MAFLCLGGLTGLRIMPVAGVVSLAIMWAGDWGHQGGIICTKYPSHNRTVTVWQSRFSQIVTPN